MRCFVRRRVQARGPAQRDSRSGRHASAPRARFAASASPPTEPRRRSRHGGGRTPAGSSRRAAAAHLAPRTPAAAIFVSRAITIALPSQAHVRERACFSPLDRSRGLLAHLLAGPASGPAHQPQLCAAHQRRAEHARPFFTLDHGSFYVDASPCFLAAGTPSSRTARRFCSQRSSTIEDRLRGHLARSPTRERQASRPSASGAASAGASPAARARTAHGTRAVAGGSCTARPARGRGLEGAAEQ